MTILPGVMEPRPTDTCFRYSPDAGHPDCICSRCGTRIVEGEMPIRVTTTNAQGKVDKNSMEYRYCELCMTGQKYFYCSMDEEFACKCERQCDECKSQRP